MQIVMVLVIVLHLVYFQRTQLATKILINLCIAIFFFQVYTPHTYADFTKTIVS